MEDKIIQIAIERNGELAGLSESGRVYWYMDTSPVDGPAKYEWTKGPVSPPLPVIE